MIFTGIELIFMLLLATFIILYRKNPGENLYNTVVSSIIEIYDKYAPYSFKTVREKTKELGQEYTIRQYFNQVLMIGGFAGMIGYFYFYSILWAIVYAGVAIMFIPYIAYLRSLRVYSEYIF